MTYFTSKYVRYLKRNTRMLNKTKQLERLYNNFVSNPTIENKQLWYSKIEEE